MASSMTKMALERIAANKKADEKENTSSLFSELENSTTESNENIDQVLSENSTPHIVEVAQEDSEIKVKKQKKKSQEKKVTDSSPKKKLTQKRSK